MNINDLKMYKDKKKKKNGLCKLIMNVCKKNVVLPREWSVILMFSLFRIPMFRLAPDSHTNVVYKIPCADCSWCYIGETGRAFSTRRKEHIRNVKTAAKGSRIGNHAWSHEHSD